MRLYELFEAGLTYRGYACTQDCSGHQAGHDWAMRYDVGSDNCPYSNNSFWEGCVSKDEPGSDQTESVVKEKWTNKYKNNIDCSRPQGFSQRAHCQDRKKNHMSGKSSK